MSVAKNLPKISYCVFTYNEEKNIEGCLQSIFSQDYPKDKLDIILVDDNSTDKTLEIARNFPVRIFKNGKHDGDLSATIGFKNATGEFFTAIGADMRFKGVDWFRKMTKPLIENPDIAVTLTRFYPHPDDSLVTRYINLDPIQRDFVYQVFSPGMDETIIGKKNGYFICQYSGVLIPPQTHGLYRMSVMRRIIDKQKIYYDMGNIMSLVNMGYTKVGYVPQAGYYHFHAENIRHLLNKRIRNIKRSYLRYNNQQSTKKNVYKWVDFQDPKDIIKLFALIISANLFFPIFVMSMFRMLKSGKWEYLLEAPITLLLVDTIIVTFLREKRGRSFIFRNLFKPLRIT